MCYRALTPMPEQALNITHHMWEAKNRLEDFRPVVIGFHSGQVLHRNMRDAADRFYTVTSPV
jgi:class 3 adenylate cyclase